RRQTRSVRHVHRRGLVLVARLRKRGGVGTEPEPAGGAERRPVGQRIAAARAVRGRVPAHALPSARGRAGPPPPGGAGTRSRRGSPRRRPCPSGDRTRAPSTPRALG